MNPQPNSYKFLRAQLRYQIFRAVVTRGRALRFDPQRAPGQIELVVDSDQIGREKFILPEERFDRDATQIHVGLGFCQQHWFATDGALAYDSLAFPARHPDRMPRRETVHHEKTHIMGRRGVLLARVAKTGHQ